MKNPVRRIYRLLGITALLAALLPEGPAVRGANALQECGVLGDAVKEFCLDPESYPAAITTGPDGNLWFTERSKIVRMTTAGEISEWPLGINDGEPWGITEGPDGNGGRALWFTEHLQGRIGRIKTGGDAPMIDWFAVPAGGRPQGITEGPDGAIWFVNYNAGQIARIDPVTCIDSSSCPITAVDLPSHSGHISNPWNIAVGPDGYLWYTDTSQWAHGIGRFTPTITCIEEKPTPPSCFREIPIPAHPRSDGDGDALIHAFPRGITAGPNNEQALWFAEGGQGTGRIGRVPTSATTSADLKLYCLDRNQWEPASITAGPDGALWFTVARFTLDTGNRIGRLTPGFEPWACDEEPPYPPGAVRFWDLSEPGLPATITLWDGALWFTEYWGHRIGRIAPIYPPPIYTVTVSTSGSGNVSSSPAGINCGNGGFDCSESYQGTQPSSLSLTASPSPGSTFTGWGGDCSGSTNPCTLAVDGNKTVQATFKANVDLAIDKVGPSVGSVGAPLTYKLTAYEHIPADVLATLNVDATVVDTLPLGFSLVSVTSSTGSCSALYKTPVTVTCSLHLSRWTPTAKIYIVAKTNHPGTWINRAKIGFGSTTFDPNLLDNEDVAVTLVR
jgi:virginiamycin B lyase